MHRVQTHRTSPTRLALRAFSVVLLATSAIAKPGTQEIGAMLSNLPDPSSSSYAALYAAAGKPHRDILALTKSEVWDIPVDRWGTAVAAAANVGVKITKLDGTSNRVLVPMSSATSMSVKQRTMMREAMDSGAAVGMTMMALPPPNAEEFALTKGMLDAAAGAAQPELVIPITDAKSLVARRISVAPAAGGYAWHGVVEETGEPVTLLWWPTGKLTGSVTYHAHMYSVHDLGGGMHAIVEMKPDGFPQEHAPMDPAMMKKMRLDYDPLVSHGDASMLMDAAKLPASPKPTQIDRSHLREREDSAAAQSSLMAPGPLEITHTPLPSNASYEPATIRLIIAYTKAAAAHYDDIQSDLIPLAIEDANESFRASGITNVKLELAYAYETSYVESGSHFEHVFRFSDRGDGYMDEVHALRDKYKADVGILIVHDPNGCGLSAEVHARPERAFAVVHHECAANMHSMAHEIGHLIGARHDEALDDSKEPFAYGHGFVFGKSWRTMMSYKDSCDGCPRIPIWSSPTVLVRGVAAGNSMSDNARVIAEQAGRVAKFR